MVENRALKFRSDLHIARKLWHSIALLVVIVFYHNMSRPDALFYSCIGATAFILVDLIRIRSQWINRKVMKVFGPLMREHERTSIAGTTYMAVSLVVVIYLFLKSIVKLTLFFIAVADPLTSYFSLKYGKDKLIGNKTLQGTLGAFATCTIISFLYYYSGSMMMDHLLLVSLLSGVIGALGELIPIGKLDDNFTFPLLSSFALYGLFSLYGYWG